MAAPREKKGCKTKALAGCGVLVVFFLGMFTGFLLVAGGLIKLVPLVETWSTPESKKFVTDHIANQLKLTPEQREKIDPIVIQALSDRWELRRDYLVASDTMMAEQVVPEIVAHLTDEQVEKLKTMLERWRKDNLMKLEPNPALERD